MTIERTVDPTFRPLGLSEAITHLQLPSNYSASDDLINGFIDSAKDYVEGRTNKVMCSSTFKMYLDEMPSEIYINRTPVSSVSSIEYYDPDNVLQTLSTSNYFTDLISKPARICITNTQSTYDRPNAVIVTFVAGYAIGSVPPKAKQAMRQLVRLYYDNRNAVSPVELKDFPHGLETLIKQLSIDEF